MARRLRPTRPPPPPPHTCEKCQRYYLSKLDLEDRHKEIEERFGDDSSSCGGWTWEPPCGGCIDCYHMMVSHGFGQEREAANRAHAAGFEYVNQSVIDTLKMATAGGGHSWGSRHSLYDCAMAGEREL